MKGQLKMKQVNLISKLNKINVAYNYFTQKIWQKDSTFQGGIWMSKTVYK